MLVALVTAGRSSSLVALDLQHMKKSKMSYEFAPVVQNKCSTAYRPVPSVVLERFPSNPTLCVYSAVKEYIHRTRPLRQQSKQKLTRLFLSFGKPHHAVVSSTIARWLKTVMAAAGIDISQFKAHSTRSASTSTAARLGVSTAQILLTADWSSASTFCKFYRREVHSAQVFGKAVLSSASL